MCGFSAEDIDTLLEATFAYVYDFNNNFYSSETRFSNGYLHHPFPRHQIGNIKVTV